MLPIIGLAAKFLPSLVGMALGDGAEAVTSSVVNAAKGLFGTDDVDAVEKAIAADPNLALQFKGKLLDIQAEAQRQAHERAMSELAAERERLAKEIEDKVNARASFASNKDVILLGMTQVVGYILVCAAVVYGCFQMLAGSLSLKGVDQGTVAAVFTVIGGVLQQLGAMAMQPNSFFYGSSKEALAGVKVMAQGITRIGEGK